MQLHGNEWNDTFNIVKFMASNVVKGYDMMIRLHNMIAMSWNIVASDGCILQQSFGYIPRFDI